MIRTDVIAFEQLSVYSVGDSTSTFHALKSMNFGRMDEGQGLSEWADRIVLCSNYY